jgi:hypothetical protein
MIEAQRITCTNNSATVISITAQSSKLSLDSGSIDWPRHSPLWDLATYPIPAGLAFTTTIHVAGGTPHSRSEQIIFAMNGRTAAYDVTGVLWDWKATLKLDAPSGRPNLPGFPADIPLNAIDFHNWDGTITASAVPTCAPRSAADVVAVCNWAKQAGYIVRPRGIMHNWSTITMAHQTAPGTKILLVDLTKSLSSATFLPASGGLPNRVKVQTGMQLDDLMEFLEAQPGGHGSAPGYSFPNTTGPGDLTMGGILAINGHGTSVPLAPNDQMPAGYGSMSNQILEFTAVVTDPASATPNQYTLRTFTRADADAKALIAHQGRAFLTDATLQVVDNYNLHCQNFTDIPYTTLFAAPVNGQTNGSSFADFLNSWGRIEVIWFPYSENPWVHVWRVEPTQPAGSVVATHPYNFVFIDNVPQSLQDITKKVVGGFPSLTPGMGQMAATIVQHGMDGKNLLGFTDSSYMPPVRNMWGPSKNSLLYIKPSVIRVTANGYAVQMRKADLQQGLADFVAFYVQLTQQYEKAGNYPINAAMEIRVTSLDDPSTVHGGPGVTAESPTTSSLSKDAVSDANGWDCALWLDSLTIPGTVSSNQFYCDIENWLLGRFTGSAGRLMPEWSKGWAYTPDGGAWTNPQFFEHIRESFTTGRPANANWAWDVTTIQKYDAGHLFTSPMLNQLFQVSGKSSSTSA